MRLEGNLLYSFMRNNKMCNRQTYIENFRNYVYFFFLCSRPSHQKLNFCLGTLYIYTNVNITDLCDWKETWNVCFLCPKWIFNISIYASMRVRFIWTTVPEQLGTVDDNDNNMLFKNCSTNSRPNVSCSPLYTPAIRSDRDVWLKLKLN